MDTPLSARDETYQRFLALLDRTFPGRVAINLHDAARFLTDQVGMPTSVEMARVYAKSGRLIPGLRKSPAATWLFPLPALAAGLADGFLGSAEPVPEELMQRALTKHQDDQRKVASRKGGRPRRSSLSFVSLDGWLIETQGNIPAAWHWSSSALDRTPEHTISEEQSKLKLALMKDRSQAAWKALAEHFEFLVAKGRAEEREAKLKILTGQRKSWRLHS